MIVNHLMKGLILSLVLLSAVTFCFAQHCNSGENTQLTIQKAILVNNTHVAAIGLSEVLKGLSREEQIELCRKFVKPIRFFDDKSGYFYIYEVNGFCVAHATQPDFQGKDISSYKDSKGGLTLMDTIKAAQNNVEFIEAYFENPATKKEEKKIIHAEMIPGTNFLIGSGFYLGVQ